MPPHTTAEKLADLRERMALTKEPGDPKAIEKAHRQSLDTARRLSGGHQAVVKTQTDGRSGLIHSHVHFNAVHPETGRTARLMEMDPKYVDVIVQRWQDYTGRNAIHEASGCTFDQIAETFVGA